MKLHVLSDLHLERYAMAPIPVLGDMLALAGDITTLDHVGLLEPLVSGYLAAGRPVLMALGNHEFYDQSYPHALRAMHRACARLGITLLHNRAVEWGGVRFLGSTLWTDYSLNPFLSVKQQMDFATALMADPRHISMPEDGGFRPFLPSDALRAHVKAKRILLARLAEPFDGPTVVITHHGPHAGSTAARFRGSPLVGAFMSDLGAVIRAFKPTAWVHGHIHDTFDYDVGATRIITNPRGYPRGRGPGPEKAMVFENAHFNPELVIEV